MFHARNFHSGLMAEQSVALKYVSSGFTILAERFRCAQGEIDVIAEHDGKLYFVEVKTSKTHERAAARIQPNQIARIRAAALQFLVKTGRPMETDMRFDAALMDQQGSIKVLPNAF